MDLWKQSNVYQQYLSMDKYIVVYSWYNDIVRCHKRKMNYTPKYRGFPYILYLGVHQMWIYANIVYIYINLKSRLN